MKNKMKRFVATTLAVLTAFTMMPTAPTQAAAKKPAIASKATIKVGQSKKLSIKANGWKVKKVTVKASKASIVKASATKKVVTIKGVKKGSATVTTTIKAIKGKTTKSFKLTTKVTVKASAPAQEETESFETTVSNQTDMVNALEMGALKKLTIATQDRTTITIPAGEFTGVDLIVDAPNATIENNGVFKTITIKSVAANTWKEKAKGNVIETLNAVGIHIVLEEGASLKNLKVSTDATGKVSVDVSGGTIASLSIASTAPVDLKLSGNAKVSEVKVDGKSDVSIDAKGTAEIGKVEVNAGGADVDVNASGNAKVGEVAVSKDAAGTTADKTTVDIKTEGNSEVSNVTTAAANSETIVTANGASKVESVKVEGSAQTTIAGTSNNTTTLDVTAATGNNTVTVNTNSVKVTSDTTDHAKNVVDNKSGSSIATTVTDTANGGSVAGGSIPAQTTGGGAATTPDSGSTSGSTDTSSSSSSTSRPKTYKLSGHVLQLVDTPKNAMLTARVIKMKSPTYSTKLSSLADIPVNITGAGNVSNTAKTDADGAFKFEGLRAGTYTVAIADTPKYLGASAQFTITGSDVTDANLTIDPLPASEMNEILNEAYKLAYNEGKWVNENGYEYNMEGGKDGASITLYAGTFTVKSDTFIPEKTSVSVYSGAKLEIYSASLEVAGGSLLMAQDEGTGKVNYEFKSANSAVKVYNAGGLGWGHDTFIGKETGTFVIGTTGQVVMSADSKGIVYDLCKYGNESEPGAVTISSFSCDGTIVVNGDVNATIAGASGLSIRGTLRVEGTVLGSSTLTVAQNGIVEFANGGKIASTVNIKMAKGAITNQVAALRPNENETCTLGGLFAYNTEYADAGITLTGSVDDGYTLGVNADTMVAYKTQNPGKFNKFLHTIEGTDYVFAGIQFTKPAGAAKFKNARITGGEAVAINGTEVTLTDVLSDGETGVYNQEHIQYFATVVSGNQISPLSEATFDFGFLWLDGDNNIIGITHARITRAGNPDS